MFLMSYWCVNRSTSEGVEALQMALHTLRMMALGGIHDHVAQVDNKQLEEISDMLCSFHDSVEGCVVNYIVSLCTSPFCRVFTDTLQIPPGTCPTLRRCCTTRLSWL